MRNLLLLAIGLLIAYWIDQRYYGGVYSSEVADMFRKIASGF